MRLAVVADGPDLAGWQATLIERVCADRELSLVRLLIVAPTGQPGRGARRGWLAALAERIESRIGHARYGAHWSNVAHDPECRLPLASLRRLPAAERFGDCGELAAALADGPQVDILVDLTEQTDGKQWTALACPTLRLRQRGQAGIRWRALGHDEVVSDRPFTELCLYLQAEPRQPPRLLRTATYVTFRRSWSQHRRLLLHKAALLIHDGLRQLARAGLQSMPAADGLPPTAPAEPAEAAGSAQPGIASLALVAGRIGRGAIARLLYAEQWQVAVGAGARGPVRLEDFTLNAPPPHCFWADPFHVRWQGEDRIFFEQLEFHHDKATIMSARLDGERLCDLRPAIAPDYHVSYPFLLAHDGDLYMLPETSQNHTVELWRCTRFPDQWERHRILLDNVSAADATIVPWQGRWWMFANVDRTGLPDHADELHIYHADDPVRGRWLPHAANPVVTDARRARMGGAMLLRDGPQLVRPAQLGSDTYGAGIRLMTVTRLSETEYEERLSDDPLAWLSRVPRVHHVHATVALTVFDICVARPRWRI